MSAQIEEKVKDCTICHDYAPVQQKEPLIPSPISDLPWAVAASDIFTFESEQFLVQQQQQQSLFRAQNSLQ